MKRVLPAFSPLVTEARYCHVRPLAGRLTGLGLICAGVESCRPDYRVARSDYACWSLEFIGEGEGSVTLTGRHHPLRPGTAFLYGPGVAHEISTDPDRPMRKYFVNFSGAAARAFLRRTGLNPGEVRRVAEPDITRLLFDELLREGQKPGHVELADSYLRLIVQKTAELPAGAELTPSPAYRTWLHCQRVLEEQYCTLKGLDELARATRVNPSHLCRLFKRFGRASPHAELTRRKLNHAAALLATTPELVKSVALQVGYDDPLHFSRLFRKHFACSPLEFQRVQAHAPR